MTPNETPPEGTQPFQPDPPAPTDPVDMSVGVLPEAEADDGDVDAALERETFDGSGFEDESELPESDFDGYAEDDVEEEEK